MAYTSIFLCKFFPDLVAYVPVPKDLTNVKTKLALNLTKRQLICFGVAATVGVPSYLLTKDIIGGSAAVLLMIGEMAPFFFLAMFERDGLPAEKILRNILRVKLWPSARPYQTENMYKYIQKEGDAIAQTQDAGEQARKTESPGR